MFFYLAAFAKRTNAQEAGSYLVGITTTGTYQPDKYNVFFEAQAQPSLLYFVKKRVGVGLATNLLMREVSIMRRPGNINQKRAWQLMPVVRYTIGYFPKWRVFVQFASGYGRDMEKSIRTGSYIYYFEKERGFISMKYAAGVDYFITERLAVEGNCSYLDQWYKGEERNYTYKLVAGVDFMLGLNYFFK